MTITGVVGGVPLRYILRSYVYVGTQLLHHRSTTLNRAAVFADIRPRPFKRFLRPLLI